MRIFLDANILFSAAKSDGAIRQLLEMLLEGGHECVADAYVVEEARRNLVAKAPERAGELARVLERMTIAAFARDAALEVSLPLIEKDRPVLAAAIRCACAALVTGDKTHFGGLHGAVVQGVRIHSPRSLALAVGITSPGKPTVEERPARYRTRKRKGKR